MGGVAKIFSSIMGGGSKAVSSAPAPTPLPPATDPAAQEAAQRAAEEERRRVMSGGRAANTLTSPLGDVSAEAEVSARKKLLGG